MSQSTVEGIRVLSFMSFFVWMLLFAVFVKGFNLMMTAIHRYRYRVRGSERSLFFGAIAKILCKPRVYNPLISLAMRRPFKHIGNYMGRWWLFNPRWKTPWLFAIRIHHIMRPDADRAIHDHPFNFRSFILKGWYWEEDVMGHMRRYKEGDTYRTAAERFHRITEVPPDGVWTLVICWPKRQRWGFLKWVSSEEIMEWDIKRPLKVVHQEYENKPYQLIDADEA